MLETERMTTPLERQRTLLQAGAFLKHVCADTSLPSSLRDEAARLLRHYPRRAELSLLGSVADLPLPNQSEEEEWLKGYPNGPHGRP